MHESSIMPVLAFFVFLTTLFATHIATKAVTYLDSTAWQKGTSWNTQHRFNISSPIQLPLWGSYRPGIYFGMKTRSPISISTGILWATTREGRNNFRHDTSQDELTQFEWVRHDGKNYGQQNLLDASYNMKINTTFVVPSVIIEPISNLSETLSNGSGRGMKEISWAQRVNVQSIDRDGDLRKSLLFYLGFEGMEAKQEKMEFITDIGILTTNRNLQSGPSETKNGKQNIFNRELDFITVIGKSALSGWFRLVLTVTAFNSRGESEENVQNNYFDISYLGMSCGDVSTGVEKVKQGLSSTIYGSDSAVFTKDGLLKNTIETKSNFIVLQIKSDFDFVLDSVFYDNVEVQSFQDLEKLSQIEMSKREEFFLDSYDETNVKDDDENNEINLDKIIAPTITGEVEIKSDVSRFNSKISSRDVSKENTVVDSRVIDRWIQMNENKFNKKFDKLYNLSSKKDENGNKMFSDSDIEAGKRVLSSVLGGIGYFYGSPRFVRSKIAYLYFFVTKFIFVLSITFYSKCFSISVDPYNFLLLFVSGVVIYVGLEILMLLLITLLLSCHYC